MRPPDSKHSSALTVGVFGGPWETGSAAQDGAIYGFADVEHAVRQALVSSDHRVVSFDITDFLRADFAQRLATVDIVFANCGPIAALLFQLREQNQLAFRIFREVRTLGWIGYAFQEFIAQALQRPHDRCLHVSEFAAGVWRNLRDPAGDCVFYPMLRNQRIVPPSIHNGRLHCGYFSRAGSDKGLDQIAGIVRRLRESGWPVEALTVCGRSDEPDLLNQCRKELAVIGVTMQHCGELDHSGTQKAIAATDVVLFPSVSSIEAAGRIVLEAYALGKRVIASDYCWGADLLAAGFKIPLDMSAPLTGPSATAFPIAELALDRWQPPAWNDDNFNFAGCEAFRLDATKIEWLLSTAAAPAPQQGPTLRMQFGWDDYRNQPAIQWCEQVAALLATEFRNRGDLLDLGGAFKRSIRRAGFEPAVSFQPVI